MTILSHFWPFCLGGTHGFFTSGPPKNPYEGDFAENPSFLTPFFGGVQNGQKRAFFDPLFLALFCLFLPFFAKNRLFLLIFSCFLLIFHVFHHISLKSLFFPKNTPFFSLFSPKKSQLLPIKSISLKITLINLKIQLFLLIFTKISLK